MPESIPLSLAKEAGELALTYFERLESIEVESKGHLDLVTEADKAVEEFLTSHLRKEFPDDGILGEEGERTVGKSGRTWVIDPIDGTFNFVRGGDQWTVAIGLIEEGSPVYGVLNAPARSKIYCGGKDIGPTLNGRILPSRSEMSQDRASAAIGFHPTIRISKRLAALEYLWDSAGMTCRICGSATASMMEIARGQTDGYIGIGDSSWDIVAACAILESAGISSSIRWSEHDLNSKFNFAIGTKEFLESIIHSKILSAE